jgi:hypothetical protein
MLRDPDCGEEGTAAIFRWHWRGPDLKRNRANENGIATLCAYREDYLPMARRWEAGGSSPAAAPRGADAHDWNDLSDLDDSPREFIDIQVIESNPHQGGHHG